MMFLETFTTFLQEIIISPDFKTCSASLQQQIKHLLFFANIADTEEWEVVKEEHNMILEDIKKGYIELNNLKWKRAIENKNFLNPNQLSPGQKMSWGQFFFQCIICFRAF